MREAATHSAAPNPRSGTGSATSDVAAGSPSSPVKVASNHGPIGPLDGWKQPAGRRRPPPWRPLPAPPAPLAGRRALPRLVRQAGSSHAATATTASTLPPPVNSIHFPSLHGLGAPQLFATLPKRVPSAELFKVAPDAKRASFSQICGGVHPISDLCKLHYYPPIVGDDGSLMAEAPEEAIVVAAERWVNALVGYVVGDRPTLGQLRTTVARLWQPKAPMNVFARMNGFFLFNLGSAEECERILTRGPWLIDGRPLVLRRWSIDFNFDRDMLMSVPMWIKFPTLQLHLWSQELLGRLVSVVGTPLYMDRTTTGVERISFARCFVEVSAVKPPPSSILIQRKSGKIEKVDVAYECDIPHCNLCHSFGHLRGQCPSLPSRPGDDGLSLGGQNHSASSQATATPRGESSLDEPKISYSVFDLAEHQCAPASASSQHQCAGSGPLLEEIVGPDTLLKPTAVNFSCATVCTPHPTVCAPHPGVPSPISAAAACVTLQPLLEARTSLAVSCASVGTLASLNSATLDAGGLLGVSGGSVPADDVVAPGSLLLSDTGNGTRQVTDSAARRPDTAAMRPVGSHDPSMDRLDCDTGTVCVTKCDSGPGHASGGSVCDTLNRLTTEPTSTPQ